MQSQLTPQLARAPEAPSRRLIESPEHQFLDGVRDVAAAGVQRRERLVPDRVENRVRGCSPEWHVPRQHLVENDAKRPDITSCVRLFTFHLLGRHIADGPGPHRACDGELQPIRGPGEAEVENLDGVFSHHQIAGLDVAVDDTVRMKLSEPFGDLGGNLERLVYLQCPAFKFLFQRLPLVMRHDNEQLPVICRVDVVNRADVPVVGDRSRLRFAPEAVARALVVTPFRRQEFERDSATQLQVASLVDDAHAAGAKL